MESDVTQSSTNKTGRKKSRFAKPAWATTGATARSKEQEDGLFSRSMRTYKEILAEEQEIEELSGDRGQKEAKRSQARRELSRDNPKRRRLSREGEDDVPAHIETRRAGRQSEHPSSAPGASDPIHIDSDSSTDERFSVSNSTSRGLQKTKVPEPGHLSRAHNSDDEDSDEDLKRLIEQARQQRLKRQQADSQADSQSTVLQPVEADKGASAVKSDHKSADPADSKPDYIVEILITSKLPGTKPVVINRKLSQRLKEVQEAYCSAMGFTPELSRGTFLSWRNQKIWGYQTCEALGLEPPSSSLDESESETIQISMELVTPEILEANRRAAERSLLEGVAEDDVTTSNNAPDEVTQENSTKVRVILRSKAYGELRIAVKPDTSIESMTQAYRRQRSVDEDKTIRLLFDGEELARDQSVADTEISDMDLIEVHIK